MTFFHQVSPKAEPALTTPDTRFGDTVSCICAGQGRFWVQKESDFTSTMADVLLCLSASHSDSGLDTVERLAALDTTALPSRLTEVPGVAGAVLVSTCNRFELYLDLTPGLAQAPSGLIEPVLHQLGEAEPSTLPWTVHRDRAATEHLFAVTAGLESVVVGEGEIAGQVRRALGKAQREGTTSTVLERLFQRAARAQRGVKARTGLGEAGRSIVRLALDLASGQIEDFARLRVLLVGTGRFAAVSLAALRERGVSQVSVWSPSGRAAAFAAKHEITPVPRGQAAVAMAQADLIVTCTGAKGHVVTPQRLLQGRGRLVGENLVSLARTGGWAADSTPTPILGCPAHTQPEPVGQAQCPVLLTATDRVQSPAPRRTLVIDLGMPRNVDPAVTGMAGIDLLDLETISLHAPLEHLTATDDARAVVAHEVAQFERSGREEQVAPAVTALRGHVQAALDAELDRVNGRTDPQTQQAIEQALRHFAGVVMHRPTLRARELAATGETDQVVEAVVALFGDHDPQAGSGSVGA